MRSAPYAAGVVAGLRPGHAPHVAGRIFDHYGGRWVRALGGDDDSTLPLPAVRAWVEGEYDAGVMFARAWLRQADDDERLDLAVRLALAGKVSRETSDGPAAASPALPQAPGPEAHGAAPAPLAPPEAEGAPCPLCGRAMPSTVAPDGHALAPVVTRGTR